jgi:exopolyphosphatase / guanosine-5'-triphosphate,3'-diphosphate pyrophosphatase
MSSPPGRFEFRIWGNRLSAFQERLNAMAHPSEPRESAETYILSSRTDAANVKLREGLLDIKVMIEQVSRLERWRPLLKAGFPLDPRTIAEQVFPALKLPAPQITQPSYTQGEFIHNLVKPNRDLWLAEVVKIRRQFTTDDFTAEFAEVEIAGLSRFETVEVESEDPATLLRAIAKLGLSSQPNTSYVRHLKLMTGTAPRVSI